MIVRHVCTLLTLATVLLAMGCCCDRLCCRRPWLPRCRPACCEVNCCYPTAVEAAVPPAVVVPPPPGKPGL
jgi:hypothetical protein